MSVRRAEMRRCRRLVDELHRTGRRAEALHTYVRLHDVLDRELGVAPGPAVRVLHRQIRAHE